MIYKNVTIEDADKMAYRELVEAVRAELVRKYPGIKDAGDVAATMVITDDDVEVSYA